jgi:hypothetical protein
VLFHDYETERPALLVTDADGRRVTSIALKGPTPAEVAQALKDALKTEPTERIFFKTDEDADQDLEPFIEALGKIEGVKSVEEEIDGVAVIARPGGLPPRVLIPLIEKFEVKGALAQPVAVRVSAKSRRTDVREALKRLPGVWYSTRDETQPTVWLNHYLMHPRRLDALDLTSDVTTNRFRFKEFPVGSPAVPLLLMPYEQSTVVAVVPHVALNALEVIARPGFDRKPLEEAFTNAGLELRR